MTYRWYMSNSKRTAPRLFISIFTAIASMVITFTVPANALSTPSAIPTGYTTPDGHLNITYGDLQWILDQVKISEAHAARTGTASTTLIPNVNTPTAGIVYPYDVTSATRCLTAADVFAAGTAAYGSTGLSDAYAFRNTEMIGIREITGECNNITNVLAEPAPANSYSAPRLPSTPQVGVQQTRPSCV